MSLVNFCKDFAVGMTRGLSIFFSERNDYAEKAYLPSVFVGQRGLQNK